jgi:hypothetical protein
LAKADDRIADLLDRRNAHLGRPELRHQPDDMRIVLGLLQRQRQLMEDQTIAAGGLGNRIIGGVLDDLPLEVKLQDRLIRHVLFPRHRQKNHPRDNQVEDCKSADPGQTPSNHCAHRCSFGCVLRTLPPAAAQRQCASPRCGI